MCRHRFWNAIIYGKGGRLNIRKLALSFITDSTFTFYSAFSYYIYMQYSRAPLLSQLQVKLLRVLNFSLPNS